MFVRLVVSREVGVEAYRCLMMFGICLLHAISQGGYGGGYADRLLMSCVVGFVVISGWFGVKFSPSKVLRLLGTAIWCSIVTCVLLGMPSRTYWVFRHQWFIWAYLFVMMFAPLVEGAVENVRQRGGEKKVLIPVFLCVFVWGTLCVNHLTIHLVPTTPGLEGYSGVTLLGVYVVVRMFRTYLESNVRSRMGSWKIALIMIGSGALALGGIYQYNSPFDLILMVALFLLFLRIRFDGILAKIVFLISPSMFAVYLYHTGPFFDVIRRCERMMVVEWGLPIPIVWLIMAVSIFIGCVLLDVPRRILVRLSKSIWSKFLQEMDEKYFALVNSK